MTARDTIPVTFRPFAAGDYERLVEIANANDPDDLTSAEAMRHWDSSWDTSRYDRLRIVAEDPAGRVVGSGQINHMQYQFHPRKYGMRIQVDPAVHRRGIGGAIYARLMDELRRRDAISVRSNAQESKTHSVAFLLHRGFREIEREWESRLDVEAFDFAPFSTAIGRVTAQGLTLTTLAEELRRDPDCLPRVWETHRDCERDVPEAEPITDIPYDLYVKQELEAPSALADAYFLAKDGDRYVGESYLHRALAMPGVLYQMLTGVLRDYRGRGIAMALKIMGIRYARDHGYKEIRTGNNTTNRPMLSINEALGFQKQPAWIEFEKTLAPPPDV